MDASSLDGIEEIVAQTTLRANEGEGARRGGKGYRFCISPNIERASCQREKKQPPAPALAPVDAALASGYIFAPIDVTCYTEALGPIRERIGAVLKIGYVDFDDLCGFAPGLSGKVFGACQAKRFGIEKFFDAVRGAGLRIRLEEDPEQTEKMLKRIAENYLPRQANQARTNNQNHHRPSESLIDRVLRHLANNKGGIARLNKAVKQARANHARRTIAVGVNWAQQRNSVGFTALLALPPPDREALDTCAEEEATAA